MKKNLLAIVLIIVSFIPLGLFGQNHSIRIGSHFKPFSFEEMATPMLMYKNAYDKANAQINGLIDYVRDALGQNIDATLRSQLNSDYKVLRGMADYLNTNGLYKDVWDHIESVRIQINDQVVEYNNRVAIARQEYEEEMQRIAEEEKRKEEEERRKALEPDEWSGTGFALNKGYLITNYHVVERAKSIIVKGIKGDFTNAFNAEVVATDIYNDLALLKIKDNRFTGFGTIPYKVKTTTSEVGEDVFVLGYPLTSTMGDEIKLTTGVISSKTGFQGDISLYQISAPVQPGNSGGPLFDSKGNLIGIVSSKHIGAENAGYAIKSSYLKTLVESAASATIVPANNSISGQPLTGKVKAVKNFIFMIECSSVENNSSSYIEQGSSSTNNNVGENNGSVVNRNKSGKTQGTLNGHEWVDLGLPSGTLWATCNVGASKPEDYGNYYAWGETSTKETYSENTYSYINHNVLLSSADPATVYWGKEWNMPTKEQWEELINNCEWTWTLNGYNVVGTNGNSIFLPAAGYRWDGSLNVVGSYGYYWSSSLLTDDPGGAWYFSFNSEYFGMGNFRNRYGGFTVRPVCSVSQK